MKISSGSAARAGPATAARAAPIAARGTEQHDKDEAAYEVFCSLADRVALEAEIAAVEAMREVSRLEATVSLVLMLLLTWSPPSRRARRSCSSRPGSR